MNDTRMQACLAADNIFKRLDADIRDRKGLKHEWSAIDRRVMNQEVRPAWLRIIEQEIAKAGDRKPEAIQNSEAQGQFAPCPGSVAASEQSIWLEYKHATPPQAIVKGYEADENECVAELLNGIPNEGGSATKATFENLVRMAFQGGLAASITRKQ